jgi:DNA polymerase
LPWLAAELDVLEPRVVVLLDATAAQAVFGAEFRITRERGKIRASSLARATLATLHPSGILRLRTETERNKAFETLVTDLKLAADRSLRASAV